MAKPFDGKKPMETDLSGKSVEDLLFLIGDQDLGFKLEAMKVLVSRGFQANYPLLERAIRNDSDADLRNGAMEVLVRFGVEAVPALIEILHDENEEVRNFSAVMLGTIGSRQAVYPLIAALRDPDVNVSHAAAEALGKIGDDAALLPLIQLLQEDFWLQYPAVVAMGEMADDRAVPHLISLLDNELLRQPVITALGKIGHCSALPSLVEILCDNGGQFVAVAATAIADIVAHGDHVVKDELAATIDKRGIENLLRLASSKNCESKGGAVTLLGFLGEKSAIPVLLSLLEDNDYEDVAKKAITEMAVATPVLMEALIATVRKFKG